MENKTPVIRRRTFVRFPIIGIGLAGLICLALAVRLRQPSTPTLIRGLRQGTTGANPTTPSTASSEARTVSSKNLEEVLAKDEWDDSDWELILSFLRLHGKNGDPDGRVEAEYRRRLKQEHLRVSSAIEDAAKPILSDIDGAEAQLLAQAILKGTTSERMSAASKLAEARIPGHIVALLEASFFQQNDPHLRQAILCALQYTGSERFKEMLTLSLLSKTGTEQDAALAILASHTSTSKSPPLELVDALREVRSKTTPSNTSPNLYRILGNYARAGNAEIEAWLKEDALGASAIEVRIYALKQLPSSCSDLPKVLEELRTQPSRAVQEAVLYRASDLVFSRQSLSALKIVTSYLSNESGSTAHSYAIDAIGRTTSFLSFWGGDALEARETIRTALARFLSASPSANLEEKAKHILAKLAKQ